MNQRKALYGEGVRHEWRCVLCGCRGVAYSALWALHAYESHYASKHREAR
jgi:hypothetical protein